MTRVISDIMTRAGHTYFYSSMTPDNPFIVIDKVMIAPGIQTAGR